MGRGKNDLKILNFPCGSLQVCACQLSRVYLIHLKYEITIPQQKITIMIWMCSNSYINGTNDINDIDDRGNNDNDKNNNNNNDDNDNYQHHYFTLTKMWLGRLWYWTTNL